MKTIVEEIPQYKAVKIKPKKKIFYVTSDGTKFDRKKNAEDHEMVLETRKKIDALVQIQTSVEINDLALNTKWYFASSEEELQTVINLFGGLKERHYKIFVNDSKEGRLNVGDWITCVFNDSGDYDWSKSFYTLEHIKKEFNKFLEFFESK